MFRKWLDDEGGSVTVQVLFFFFLLFGTTGLVVDFGRAYTLNTQMQAYADQVALAAAQELNQAPGSRARARRAAGFENDQILQKIGSFTSDDDATIKISNLILTNGLPPSFNGAQYQVGDILAYEATSDATATHAVAVVAPRTVSFALLPLANAFGADIADGVSQQTVAAARAEIEYCDLAPLVMCNPFESGAEYDANGNLVRGDSRWEDDIRRLGDGRRLEMVVSGIPNGFRVPNNEARVWIDDRADSAGACDALAAPTNPGDTTEQARNRCLLAISEPRMSCVGPGDTIRFTNGDPMDVAVALNTRFDVYDAPFDEVLVSGGTTSHTNEDLLDYLHPDQNVIKGRGWTDEDGDGVPDGSGYDDLQPIEASPSKPHPIHDDREIGPGERVYSNIRGRYMEDYFNSNFPDQGGVPDGINNRYDLYNYESDEANNLLDNFVTNDDGSLIENPRPVHFPRELTAEERERQRRLVRVPVVNCRAATLNPDTNDYEGEFFEAAQIFLIQPVRPSPDTVFIQTEVISDAPPYGLGSTGERVLSVLVR